MQYTKTHFLNQRLPGNPDGRLQFDILKEKEMILLEKDNKQAVYLPTSTFSF